MPRAALLLALLCVGCPPARVTRPYAPPPASELLAYLTFLRERAPTINADTKSDVRLDNQRVNLTVMMLGAWGGKLRFQALRPNNAMAADLASDGTEYCFLDVGANCGECGPATANSVARLVRIALEPDEVVTLLLGSAPLLEDAETTIDWDERGGREILTQRRGDEVRRIVLDGRDRRWDVLEAESLVGGKRAWRIQHKGFRDVKTEAGETIRLPTDSLFEQAGDTVRISWRDQRVGEPLPEAKFRLTLPPGLRTCQQ